MNYIDIVDENREQTERDKMVLKIAPLVFDFSNQSLTEKGLESLKKNGLRFFGESELESLYKIVDVFMETKKGEIE